MTDRQPLSLESYLEENPWPERMLARGRPLEWFWRFELPVPGSSIWPYLIDVSRLNRSIGLGRMDLEERDGILHGSSTAGGLRHEWVEEPWDWVAGRRIDYLRTYSRGFPKWLRTAYFLEDDGDNGAVVVYLGFIPRGLVGRVALRLGTSPLKEKFATVFRALAAEAGAEKPAVFEGPAPELTSTGPKRIESISKNLIADGISKEAVQALLEVVTRSDETDAYRIQVRRLSRQSGIAIGELLRACLHGTRYGLLELSWDVICPHCRGVRDEAPNLVDVPERGACEVCEIDFDTDDANSVEITFHVHPAIRPIGKVFYCSAEPLSRRHIVVQQALAPGESRVVAPELAAGRYRMRLQGDKEGGHYLDVAEGMGAASVSWETGVGPSAVAVDVNPDIELSNESDERRTFVVEELGWAHDALRPADLFNFQEFRDLFSEQYLAADVQLNIGEQTILFTDIVGSTSFYAESGDPAAFVAVKEHFRLIYEAVRENGGAVVKTIGDAVMAGFGTPLDSLRAAREIHAAFPEDSELPIRVRVSIHRGPCIAVNLNSGIDYFGGTVNLAAKLQACCEAGEVALSDSVREAAGVGELLDGDGGRVESRIHDFKVYGELPFTLWTP